MRLTTYTDYALRVLMYLGVTPRLATVGEIARAYGISRNHLVKIVHELSSRGYVRTVRGRRGGIELGRPPAEINLGTVVRETETDLALVQCLRPGNTGQCRVEGACVLRHALQGALDAFLHELDRYTLADLLEPRRQLQRSLAVPGSVGVAVPVSFC